MRSARNTLFNAVTFSKLRLKLWLSALTTKLSEEVKAIKYKGRGLGLFCRFLNSRLHSLKEDNRGTLNLVFSKDDELYFGFFFQANRQTKLRSIVGLIKARKKDHLLVILT